MFAEIQKDRLRVRLTALGLHRDRILQVRIRRMLHIRKVIFVVQELLHRILFPTAPVLQKQLALFFPN